MRTSLLNDFMEQECDDVVRSMLISDIEKIALENVTQFKEYNFNRFNVYLNVVEKQVRIEDELDVEETGVFTIGLADFLKLLKEDR